MSFTTGLGVSWLISTSIALKPIAKPTTQSSNDKASSSGVQRCARMRFTLSLPIAKFNPEQTTTCSTLCQTKFTEFDREMERRLYLVSQSIKKASRVYSEDEARYMTPFSSIPFMDDCEAVPSACYGEKLAFTEGDTSYANTESSTSCSRQEQRTSICSSTRLLSCNCRIVLVLPLVHYVAEPTNWKFGPAVHFNQVSCSAQAIVARLNEKSQILGWQTVLGDPPGNILPRDCSEVAEPDKQTCLCMGGVHNCLRQLSFTPDQLHGPMPHNLGFHRLVRLSEYRNHFLADCEKLGNFDQLPINQPEPHQPLLTDFPYYFAPEAINAEQIASTSVSVVSEISNLDSLLHFQEGSTMGAAPLLRVPSRTAGPPYLVAWGNSASTWAKLARINQLLMISRRSDQIDGVLTENLDKVLVYMQRVMGKLDIKERPSLDMTLDEDDTDNNIWVEDDHHWIASDEDTDRDSHDDYLNSAVREINRIFRRASRVNNYLKRSTLNEELFDSMVQALEKKLKKSFPNIPLPEPPKVESAPTADSPDEEEID